MASSAALHLPISTAFSLFRLPSHPPRYFRSAIVPKPSPFIRIRRRFPEHSVSLPRATGPDGNLNGDSDASVQRGLLLLPSKATIVVAACTIGLLTGVGVVLFNNAVHELRDFFWDGIPSQGTSWLREEPLEEIWLRVILVPVCGGALVGILNLLQDALQNSSSRIISSNLKGLLEPIFKAIAASITLGTGNSLGPEGPSVEIGASIAKGVGKMLKCEDKSLSLAAAGSAAGISSGFNASVAGCFFAVESVLWPSPADAYASLTNSTSMVILSAVIASVVSELGLGPVPAFTVPQYDFRTASELPLYLLLGIICGLVSLALTKCTFYAREVVEYMRKTTRIPKPFYPALGGLAVGVIALSYPEVLYWGFENVDTLLESRPLVKSLSADILLQLVGVKIIATSLTRASGLVGGYYAPSLFIGAATGVAYGKLVADILPFTGALYSLSSLEVASPQAFGLVGMGATLAGVCQVPLTSVLLLFELTQDYRIVLPLLGAVGISSWITSSQNSKDSVNKVDTSESNDVKPPPYSLSNFRDVTKDSFAFAYADEQREIKNSVCLHKSLNTDRQRNLKVSQAMQTRYAAALPNSTLSEAIALMLVEKQSCALIVDEDNIFLGLLTVEDLQTCCDSAASNEKQLEVDKLLISELCNLRSEICQSRSVSPEESLLSARKIMDLHGVDRLPVVSKLNEASTRGYAVGLLYRQSIDTICRVMAAKELLGLP